MARKLLRLDLDELYTEGYYYTHFDIGGAGHSILILEELKDAFLNEFARIWRAKAEKFLESWPDWEG